MRDKTKKKFHLVKPILNFRLYNINEKLTEITDSFKKNI